MAEEAEQSTTKKQRKKRTSGKFMLLGVLKDAPSESDVHRQIYVVEAEGATIKALRNAAQSHEIAVGDFKIVCVRDTFSVREKQLKLIER